MRLSQRLALAVLACASASFVLGGEIIGNTYISEKDGVIEITAAAWNIKDNEAPGGFKIATLTPKQPLKGTVTSVEIFRLANPGGAVTPDTMLQMLRDGFVKQGMEASAIETRRISGKRVLALPLAMSKAGGRSNGLVYMMQGEKSLYWAQFFANVAVWDEARALFDEVMEKVKY